jgi:hypothetical protein
MRTDHIEAQWLQLCASRSPVKKYFDPAHPLELLFGSDERGRAVLALITPDELILEDLSRDVSTRSSRRGDGRWAITWTLFDDSLFLTFVRLAVDLAERAAAAEPRAALSEFLRALASWQTLMRPRPPKQLTLEQLRGLVAELWAGEAIVGADLPREELVRAWSGPLGGAQDYTFSSGCAWEVKAKRSSATDVKIASAEQLDPIDKDLRLVVCALDERSVEIAHARSLADLVRSWRTALATHPTELHLFDRLVASLGVDMADPYYEQTAFIMQQMTVFRVHGDFPSLRAAHMPRAVTSVRYKLDLRGLDSWIVTEGDPS